MRKKFDEELEILNSSLVEMGSLIERSIEASVEALIKKDTGLAEKVIDMDHEVDEKERFIERHCLKLLLQQQPVAKDLRLISTALKMITDMERIGDQAADISEITIRLAPQEYIKELIHIPQMARAAIKMVTDSIDAFVKKDLALAKQVIDNDDIVDNLFDVIKLELLELIQKDIKHGEQSIDFLMIAKYLERIGDHAENIAEWVIFSITGEHKNQKIM